MGGRQEADLVQPGLTAALFGQNQVAHVNRVEGATKDADTHDDHPPEP
jgi:hypothetical protein